MKGSSFTALAVSGLLMVSGVFIATARRPLPLQEFISQPGELPMRLQPLQPPATGSTEEQPHDLAGMEKHLRRLLAASSGAERDRRLLRFSKDFSASDWPLAMKALLNLGYDVLGEERVLLASAWVLVDPRAASESDENLPQIILPLWAEADPEGALAWADGYKPKSGGFPRNYPVMVLGIMMKSDSSRVAAELEKRFGAETGASSKLGEESIGFQLARMDRETMNSWLGCLSTGLRRRVLVSSMNAITQGHPEEVAKWIREDPSLLPFLYGSSPYREWAKRDSDAAEAAYNQLSPGPMRENAAKGLAQYYGEANHGKAIAMLESIPEREQQSLIQGWVNNAEIKGTQAFGIEAAGKMIDLDRRRSAYRRLLSTWITKDAEEAADWMENQNPSDPILRECIEEVKSRP